MTLSLQIRFATDMHILCRLFLLTNAAHRGLPKDLQDFLYMGRRARVLPQIDFALGTSILNGSVIDRKGFCT
jgi:hypothetical protein